MITDSYIYRKDGEKIRRLYLLYIDEDDDKLCDCCDEKKRCASIVDLVGNVSVVCKDCLNEMIKEFETI